jgi:hypothetical protein
VLGEDLAFKVSDDDRVAGLVAVADDEDLSNAFSTSIF